MIPVDLHLDDRTRSRIWANEAIDMAALIKGSTAPAYQVTIGTSSEGGPNFTILESAGKGSNLSSTEWMAAFDIYMAVYLQQHMGALQGLSAHKSIMMNLMSTGADWREYDSRYRLLVQKGLLNWGQHHSALLNAAMLKMLSKPQGQRLTKTQAPAERSLRIPKGYCLNFHKKSHCDRPNCPYNHECPKCKKEHPLAKCEEGTKSEAEQSSFRKQKAT